MLRKRIYLYWIENEEWLEHVFELKFYEERLQYEEKVHEYAIKNFEKESYKCLFLFSPSLQSEMNSRHMIYTTFTLYWLKDFNKQFKA